MNLIKKILLAQATVLALWAASAQAMTDEEIAQRIKPVGEVCVQGQECANAPLQRRLPMCRAGAVRLPLQAVVVTKLSAKHCAACHGIRVIGRTENRRFSRLASPCRCERWP